MIPQSELFAQSETRNLLLWVKKMRIFSLLFISVFGKTWNKPNYWDAVKTAKEGISGWLVLIYFVEIGNPGFRYGYSMKIYESFYFVNLLIFREHEQQQR